MQVTSYYHRTNPDESGYTLGNFREIWSACFEAIGARSVVEVGAERGRLTQELLDWAQSNGARVTAIEPEPLEDLLELLEEYPEELEVVEELSLDALQHLPIPDVVVLDGDHNYYTLSGELRLISERAPEGRLPFLIFHDVCWPLARRDQYHAPELIPEEHRQPYGADIKVVRGDPGTVEYGLPFEWGALREGGPGNGVMTAIEDFMTDRQDLRLAVIPLFFGCGLLWSQEAPYADAVSEIVDPWDRNPVLERIERVRATQLTQRHAREQEIDDITAELNEARAELHRVREELARRDAALETVLRSRSLAVAERLARLRRRDGAGFSREGIRRLIAPDEPQG
jgi:Methyltransferase domain